MRTFFLLCMIIFSPITLADQSFDSFLKDIEKEITCLGIDPSVIQELFGENPEPNAFIEYRYEPRTPKKGSKSSVKPTAAEKFAASQRKYVSETRLKKAKAFLRDPEVNVVLEQLELEYGVDKEAILALWSVESSFGRNKGGHNIPHVLATLAWHPKERRKAFFRKELLVAIEIYAQGHVTQENFTGSWAGAMGHLQFMPTTFVLYAVDFDGDGKADIWNNRNDAFASAANYLKGLGWQKNTDWKTGFTLNQKINKGIFYATGLSKQRVFKRNSNGNKIYKNEEAVILRYKPYRLPARIFNWRGVPVPKPVPFDQSVYLYLPYGNEKDLNGYLLHQNFHVVLSWNLSSYFAFGVLSIMDELQIVKAL
jgi:membrane-bound lytic murein transglycosylase B